MRYLRSPAAKETMFNVGTEPVGSSPEQLATVLNAEIDKLTKLVKLLGLRID